TPAFFSRGSVEGCEAAAGFFPWIEVREATEIKIGVKMRRLLVFLNDGAPVIRRFEQRIGGGIVGRAAPFGAAERARANADRVTQGNIDIFTGDEWDGVKLFVGIAIDEFEEAVFTGCGDDVALLAIDCSGKYGTHLRQIPIVNVVRDCLV